MRQEEFLYETEFKALSAAKINYAVCGGLAVILHGYARATVDLDIIVELTKQNLEKLYDTLAKLNYRPQSPLNKNIFTDREKLKKLGEEKNMKVVAFQNSSDPMKIIDIGVNLLESQEMLKRKKIIKAKDIGIPVIDIKDLIKMKEQLARSKDLNDAKNLKEIKKK